MRLNGAVAGVCIALAAAACNVRDPGPVAEGEVVYGQLGSALDEFLRDAASEGFSGAVLVARDDALILKKGYGLADRKENVPNTADTVFNICSISKVFTASAILHLEMQGKLQVEERLEEHLGDFPGDKSTATIHHLLTHTAGLAVRGTDVERTSRSAYIQAMKDAPLESVPGEEYRYTNAGYSLLAALVEVVSRQPFESYVREHLLTPAGMNRTSFPGAVRDDDLHIARGYPNGSAMEPVELGAFVWGNRGAGRMLTTVGDLYLWELALRNGSVLSDRARKKMFTAYHDDEGYGWHVAETEHGTTVHHRGCGNPGFQGQFARYPDDGVTVLLLSNNSDGWRRRIWDGIAERVLPGEQS